MPTLQQTTSHLKTLAEESGAKIETFVQLLDAGAILVVHWDRSDIVSTALPLECHIFFSSDDDRDGGFKWAFAYDAARFIWSIEEGMGHFEAEDYCRCYVDTIEDIDNYLMDRPYGRRAKKVVDTSP